MSYKRFDVELDDEPGTVAPVAFKIFIGSHDQVSVNYARHVRRRVESLCGPEMPVLHVFWNLALLRHIELREHAAREAAQCEMIVLCLDSAGDLPEHVKSWMKCIPARTHPGEAALVTLLPSRPGAEPPAQLNFLREAALSRNMDFICNQEESPQGKTTGPAPICLAQERKRIIPVSFPPRPSAWPCHSEKARLRN